MESSVPAMMRLMHDACRLGTASVEAVGHVSGFWGVIESRNWELSSLFGRRHLYPAWYSLQAPARTSSFKFQWATRRGRLQVLQRFPTLLSALLYHLLNISQSYASSSMSTNPSTTSCPSNFNVIFQKALKAYKTKTKQDLITHPLVTQLQACNSPADILFILQDQVHQFEESQSGDERLRRWLDPTINVLYAFSETLGQGVGLVRIN